MVEDEDKKDDEKVELDSTGQAVAYISLDQARVLAMEHAPATTETSMGGAMPVESLYGRCQARKRAKTTTTSGFRTAPPKVSEGSPATSSSPSTKPAQSGFARYLASPNHHVLPHM